MQIKGKQLRTRIIHNSWHSSTRLEPPVGAAKLLQSWSRPVAVPGNWPLSVLGAQALPCAHAWKRNLLSFYSSTFSVLVNEDVLGHTPEKVWMVMMLMMMIMMILALATILFILYLTYETLGMQNKVIYKISSTGRSYCCHHLHFQYWDLRGNILVHDLQQMFYHL